MKKYIVIVLLLVAGIALACSYFQILSPMEDKPLLEYYDDLRLHDSKKIHDSFFDRADNGAWVVWSDDGVYIFQESLYRVSCTEKVTFSEDTFLCVADGYKARLFGQDWVFGSENGVLLIPAGTSNYINVGKEYDTEITIEEARKNILFVTKQEVEENLDRLLISKNDRAFLNELLSYVD